METMEAGSMSKQEKATILGWLVFLFGTGYLIWHLFFSDGVLETGVISEDVRDWAYRLFWLYLAGFVLINYRDRTLEEDERDRQIVAKAFKAGYVALLLFLLLAAAVVGMDSYQPFVKSRSSAWLEVFFLLCMVSSLLVHASTRGFCYWRDRQ